MATSTVTRRRTALLILVSVLSSASSKSSPPPPPPVVACARLNNDDGASTRHIPSTTPAAPHITSLSAATSSSLIVLNHQLRGGGGGSKFGKNKNANDEEEEYEYYEEYYDDDDEYYNDNEYYLDEYAEYYHDEEEDVRDTKKKKSSNKKSSSSRSSADEQDDETQNQGGGSSSKKLFGIGGSNKQQQQESGNTKLTKKEKKKQTSKSRFMSSTTTRASKASFVPSLRSSPSSRFSYRGGGHSFGGGTAITALLSKTTSILSNYISTLSTFVLSLLQPIVSSLNSMAYYTYSTLSHWITLSIQLLRDVIDMIWYGPGIDGITTTGVMSRYGGLQSILFGSTWSMVVTAVVGVGLISWMVNAALTPSDNDDEMDRSSGSGGRMFRPWTWLGRGRRSNIIEDDDDEEEEDDFIAANPHFSLEPPTVDEELQFLSRTFKSANPTTKQRISETITTSSQGFLRRLTNNRRSRERSSHKSPKRQRKMTVKSIQKWWKRDPNMINGGQPINIIKRSSSNNNKNKNPSINQLQNQLHKSEQERLQLQNDIQKLQLRLQKAHADARNIASQNKWLEKQTSRADQILSRAVEVERKKANEEVERVRGEMKGLLERERLIMRGNSTYPNGVGTGGGGGRRMFGGGNDVDLNRSPNKRVLDGVKIVRDVDDYDDDDMLDENGRPPWRAM